MKNLKHIFVIFLCSIMIQALASDGAGGGNGGDPYLTHARPFPDDSKLSLAITLATQKLEASKLPKNLIESMVEEIRILKQDGKFLFISDIVSIASGDTAPLDAGQFTTYGAMTRPQINEVVFFTDRALSLDLAAFTKLLIHEILHHTLRDELAKNEEFIEYTSKAVMSDDASFERILLALDGGPFTPEIIYVPEITMELHKLGTVLEEKDFEARAFVECTFDEGLAKPNHCGRKEISISKGANLETLKMEAFSFEIPRVVAPEVWMKVCFTHKGEQVLFGTDAGCLKFSPQDAVSTLGHISFYSVKPFELSARIDGKSVEGWLEENNVKKLSYDLVVSPEILNTKAKVGVRVFGDVTQSQTQMSSDMIVAFPGKVDGRSFITLRGTLSYGTLGLNYLSMFTFSSAYSQLVPTEAKTLELSSTSINKKIDGAWNTNLIFDGLMPSLSNSSSFQTMTADNVVFDLQCTDGKISGKTKLAYAFGKKVKKFELPLSGQCKTLPYTFALKKFPIHIKSHHTYRDQDHRILKKNLTLKVNFIGDESPGITIIENGEEIGSSTELMRIRSY